MIFTESTIKISNNVSKMDSTIVLYRGDKNVEIRFTILQSPFKYSNTVATNVIESTNASYGQLVIKTPNDKPPIFSEVSATKEGTVLFTITKEMIDEIEELGNYTFQIRLLDENKQSRVTIPPVENGIEIKEPIAIEDDNTTNVVGLAKANYAVATLSDVDTPTFDDNGKYNKTNWNDGDIITNASLNKIEEGIYTTNENVNTKSAFTNTQLDNKFGALNFTGSLNTGLNKSMTLSEAFPDILDGKYDAIKQCKLTVKVDGATIVNLTENYNMVQWQMYDNDNNLLSTAYSKPKVVRNVYFAPNDYVQLICWLDATYTPGASGSGISYDTPGYITVMLTISRSKNTEEYINKIKNLRITTTLRSLNVLVKDNKIVYTPTNDYNPATKKYVDDNKIGYIKSETVGETIDTSTMVSSFSNNSYIYESNNVTYLEVGKEYHVIVNGIRYRALCINNMPGNDQIYESIAVNGDGFSIAVMNKIGYNTKYYQDNTKCAYEINLSDELLAAPPTIQILKMDIEYIPTYLMPKDLGILNSISVNRIGDIGTSSAAIGYKNTASNDFTFAMGMNTTANAVAAHAEGGFTVANASYSHAEGFKSISTGQYSHVEGIVCESSGQGSHAEGYYTVASGERSHSEGCFTEAASQYQHVQGKYNVVDSTGAYAHIVGNGANKNARSNAHTLDWKGNGWYAGKISQEGTPTENKDLATKKYVDDNIVIHPLPIYKMAEAPTMITYTVNIMDLKKLTTYGAIRDINSTKYQRYHFIYPCDDGTNKTIVNTGDDINDTTFRVYHYDNSSTLTFNNVRYSIDYTKHSTSTDVIVTEYIQNYLGIYNTREYAPTEDYNPATKKYVDDNMTTAINGVKGDLGTEELTTTAKDLKGAVNELNSQYKDIAKKTIIEENKIYLAKNDGTKIDSGTKLPSSIISDAQLKSVMRELIADGTLKELSTDSYSSWLAIGDSITVGYNNNNISYADIISEKYGIYLDKDAITGSNMSSDQTQFGNGFYKRIDNDKNDYNLITVMGGLNDFSHATLPLGTFNANIKTTDEPTSFYDGIVILCKKLVKKYPKSKIVFLSSNRDNTYNNKNAESYEQFMEAIDAVCSYFSIPFYRIDDLCGFNRDVYKNQGIDNGDLNNNDIHPKTLGHRKIAGAICDCINFINPVDAWGKGTLNITQLSSIIPKDATISDIKKALTVKISYNNGVEFEITNYDVDGNITEGTSTFTIGYRGVTATTTFKTGEASGAGITPSFQLTSPISVDSTTKKVDIGVNPFSEAKATTIKCKFNATLNDNSVGVSLLRCHGTNANEVLGVSINAVGLNTNRVSIVYGTASQVIYNSSTNDYLEFGVDTELFLVWDGATTISIYNVDSNGIKWSKIITNVTIKTGEGSFYFGNNDTNRYFTGVLTTFNVYDIAFTEQDVLNNI